MVVVLFRRGFAGKAGILSDRMPVGDANGRKMALAGLFIGEIAFNRRPCRHFQRR